MPANWYGSARLSMFGRRFSQRKMMRLPSMTDQSSG
jgi:hypothetical protein